MTRWSTLPLLLLALVACGSEEDDASSGNLPTTPTTPAAPDPNAPVIPPPDPNDPLALEMATRAAQFAANMTPATPVFRGSLTTGQAQDYQAILQSDRCFKIIGVGGAGVADLDLFLFDPNNIQIQQDTASDAYPVLGLTHAICPDLAGSYRVQVRIVDGAGDFGVQVFNSAP